MAFPSALCFETYTSQYDNENVQTEFTSGRTRLRRRGDRNNDVVNVSITTDDAGLTDFKTYFVGDAGSGGLVHNGPYFVGGIKKNGLIRIIAGSYELNYLAQGVWRISYTFELLARQFTSEKVTYDAVVANGGFPLP